MKQFNNLYDSICMAIIWMLECFMAATLTIFVIIPFSKKGYYVGSVIGSIILLFVIICTIWIIMQNYFDWWNVNSHQIEYKKLFRKKIVLSTEDIIKIAKLNETRFGFNKFLPLCGIHSFEAYVIYSSSAKITILINKRNEELLKKQFEKECYKEIFVDQTLELSTKNDKAFG